MALIALKEWAIKHGITDATARQRAQRGSFETAVKIGRDWLIDEDEELVDHRVKSGNYIGFREKYKSNE